MTESHPTGMKDGGGPAATAGAADSDVRFAVPLTAHLGRHRVAAFAVDLLQRMSERHGRPIASELYLSVNTVKTHQRMIYRKLGAAGRRDAVRRAKQLRIL